LIQKKNQLQLFGTVVQVQFDSMLEETVQDLLEKFFFNLFADSKNNFLLLSPECSTSSSIAPDLLMEKSNL